MNGKSRPRTSPKPPPLRKEIAAPICIALGKVFRDLRLKRRLSIYAVAKLAGVSREMVRQSFPVFTYEPSSDRAK